MALRTLKKHPSEIREYYFEFGPAEFEAGERGSVWGGDLITGTLGAAAGAFAGLLCPVWMSLLSFASAATVSVTVARADGKANDLTLGTPYLVGTRAAVRVTGGTNGITYLLTCTIAANAITYTLVQQGRLKLTADLGA